MLKFSLCESCVKGKAVYFFYEPPQRYTVCYWAADGNKKWSCAHEKRLIWNSAQPRSAGERSPVEEIVGSSGGNGLIRAHGRWRIETGRRWTTSSVHELGCRYGRQRRTRSSTLGIIIVCSRTSEGILIFSLTSLPSCQYSILRLQHHKRSTLFTLIQHDIQKKCLFGKNKTRIK